MEIYLGEKGLNKSWQDSFEKTIKCSKCSKKAKIMFVGFENVEKDFICDLYETTGKKGGLWLHDACAVAVYLCPNCLEPTTLINQA